MPETPSFPPGAFSWTDLGTSDLDAGNRFYGELFGWTANPMPMGPDEFYVMQELNGKTVGAIYKQMQPGVPPSWLVYITVENVDASAAKAKELGATIVMEPFDVFDVGRQAVLADPQGAMLALWQPKTNPGFGIYAEPGSWCWFEASALDEEKAKAFYPALFGWTTKGSPEYTEWHLDGKGIGGMMKSQSPEGTPSYWMGYVAVEDCDATVAKAQSLGASVYVPPTDYPGVGRFSVLADPQGAVFAVIKVAM